jgi:hypothetical protein
MDVIRIMDGGSAPAEMPAFETTPYKARRIDAATARPKKRNCGNRSPVALPLLSYRKRMPATPARMPAALKASSVSPRITNDRRTTPTVFKR